MADADEEDEVGNIDPPVDGPGEPGDPQAGLLLVNVSGGGPEDDRN